MPEEKPPAGPRTALDDAREEEKALFGHGELPSRWTKTAFLFNTDEVRDIELHLTDADWADMLRYPFHEDWKNGSVAFMNTTWEHVQIRIKGSSSVSECLTHQNGDDDDLLRCFTLSMKLKFPKHDHFYGLKGISLFASTFDQAAVIDRFANSLFRELGVPAIRQNHVQVKLSVGGAPVKILGLHYLSDDVDKDFMNTYYSGGGRVMKYVWPGNDDEYWINFGTKEGTQNATRLLGFNREILAASDDYELVQVLKKYIHIDNWAKYYAIDRAIMHWDGPTSFWRDDNVHWTHNSQFYQDDPDATDADKFSIIPWDMRMTFMGFDETTVYNQVMGLDGWEKHMHAKGLSDTVADGYAAWDAPICGEETGCIDCEEAMGWEQLHPSCTRVSRAFARGLRKEYHEAVRQLLSGPMQLHRVQAKLDRWHDAIRPFVEQDKAAGVYPRFQAGGDPLSDDWEMFFSHFRNETVPRYIANLRSHVSCDRGYDPNKWSDEVFSFEARSGVKDDPPDDYDYTGGLPQTWPAYPDGVQAQELIM